MQLPLERDQLIDLAFLLEQQGKMTKGAAEDQLNWCAMAKAKGPAPDEHPEDYRHAILRIEAAARVTADVAKRLFGASLLMHAILNCPEALNALRKANP